MLSQPTRGQGIWAAAIMAAVLASQAAFADTVQLSSLQVANQPGANAKVNTSAGGNPLTINGQKFETGLGVQAPSKIVINLNRGSDRFKASIGIDDEGEGGSAQFTIVGDDRRLWPTAAQGRGAGGGGGRGRGGPPPVTSGNPAQDIDIDVSGIRVLVLEVTAPGGAGRGRGGGGAGAGGGRAGGAAPLLAHGDWANASFNVTGAKPEIPVLPKEEFTVLTPKEPETPRINGAKVFGVRPGNPFLFTVSTTGQRPITFSADGLPAGLTLDPNTGFITGKVANRGEYKATLHAKNAKGTADSPLRIVVGDTICLTPQLGWNSWNCFGPAVTAQNVMSAADAMVNSGLINHGWTYVNVDDYWEYNAGLANRGDTTMQDMEARAPDGTINSNKRFPSMKAMADYIHSKGLKAGLYSSPGPTTCGGCTASYEHEAQDVKSWSDWGYDYIKYDWCSYGGTPEGRGGPGTDPREVAIRPYKLLGDLLKKTDRDIVFSLCQYGNQNVWEWGADVGGNSWRTTGDITDTWASLSNIWDSQAERNGAPTTMAQHAGPGHWNDADMMIVGMVSVASGRNFHPTNLSPNEQYTHVSAWILMDCPMLIGCDMTRFDDFTLGLLTNDEVLAVNQDPLGKAASRVVDKIRGGGFEVWAKDMEDGSKAVGIFNRSEMEGKYALQFSDIGISGKQNVRDLWRQKDAGSAESAYETSVPRHGVVMVKLSPAK